AHVREHRAEALREAGLIELRDVLALEVRREADETARRDDARAADPRDQNVVGAIYGRGRRLRQARERLRRERHRRAAPRAVERDEARTEPVEAAEVLVARGLVDAALAPERRLVRHHGEAVRLQVAVAAALADEIVDDDTPGRRRDEAALALTVQLRGAALIVDQRRDPAALAPLALHAVEPRAVVHRDVGRQPAAVLVAADVFRQDDDRLDAFRLQLRGN